MILEIPPLLKKKLDGLRDMGLYEATEFKKSVIVSMLDDKTKFYTIDLIDERLRSLDTGSAKAIGDDEVLTEMVDRWIR